MAKDNSNTSGGRTSKDSNSRGGGASGGSKGQDRGRDSGKDNSRTNSGKATKDANNRGTGVDGGSKGLGSPGRGQKSWFEHLTEVASERWQTPTARSPGYLQSIPGPIGAAVTVGTATARYLSERGIAVNTPDPVTENRTGKYSESRTLQPQNPAQPGTPLPSDVPAPQSPSPDYLQSAGRPPLEAAFDMALRSGRSRVRIPLLGSVRGARGAGVSIR